VFSSFLFTSLIGIINNIINKYNVKIKFSKTDFLGKKRLKIFKY